MSRGLVDELAWEGEAMSEMEEGLLFLCWDNEQKAFCKRESGTYSLIEK